MGCNEFVIFASHRDGTKVLLQRHVVGFEHLARDCHFQRGPPVTGICPV